MAPLRPLLAAFLLGTALPALAAPTAAPTVGVDLQGIDKSVKPGDSFDAYVNGGWRKNTEIPADRTSLGSFVTVTLEVERRNVDIIANAASANPAAGTDARRIGDYYSAYLDTAGIEARGTRPLQPILARIDAIGDRRTLSAELGSTLRADTDPLNMTNFWTENLMGVFVAQDLANPNRNIAYLLQGGIGMPDRDYYLSDAPAIAKVRDAYRTYVAAMAKLLGWQDAERRAAAIVDLETKIARIHATAVDAQDAKATETWRRADFASKAPGLDWEAFLAAAQLGDQDEIIAWHPKPIVGLSALVASEPIDTWKDWLKFHTASSYASVLPKAYDDLRFSFYGKTLSGQQALRPRDRRALNATGAALGDAVGKIYVERHFPAASKAQIETMVDNIKAAFARRVQALDWMAPATKAEALRKIETLEIGVGYPERWRSYAQLEVRPDDAFGNAWRAEEYEYRHQLSKLGQPVDRREWWLFPHTVNAVFLPLQNAQNYPAGILEPPFFDPNADPAFNYGSIGSVIGHEISHSFDNLGSDFDAEGRVRNWWTDADRARFKAEGDALIKQYNAYQAFPDLTVNGELTLGENIADVAGLAAAYDAYKASLGGKPAPVINGLTGDQRFFIAYGQSRRESTREPSIRAQIASGSHALGRWRAETVRNIDAWYDAFGVKPGEALYLPPAQRVRVW